MADSKTFWRGSRVGGLVFGALAVMAVLVGLAYACTTFYGKLTVTGNGASPGSANASGDASSMNWCNGPNLGANVTSNSTGSVHVAVAPAAAGSPCNGNKLFSGEHTIRWVSGTWLPTDPTSPDCMTTSDPAIGTFSVSSGGTGSATSSGFNPGGPGAISICVTRGSNGNQVEVAVV